MEYKYIYNEQGEKEAVIVPIREWEYIARYGKIEAKNAEGDFDPEKYKGLFKNNKWDVVDEFRKLRDEWKRDF